MLDGAKNEERNQAALPEFLSHLSEQSGTNFSQSLTRALESWQPCDKMRACGVWESSILEP
jgi:hypothetical protein